jgi:hypothetical protein
MTPGFPQVCRRLAIPMLAACLAFAPTSARGQRPAAAGSHPAGPTSADRLWVTTFPLDDARHVMLVVDPILKQVAVYHVDAVTGTLTLKSSRDISADLQVGDFNAQEPKPAALRKMLEMKAVPSPSR